MWKDPSYHNDCPTMKNPKITPVEEEEFRLEDLTPEEMKRVAAHLASLIRSKTLDKPSEEDQ